jgi:hypothetical protein
LRKAITCIEQPHLSIHLDYDYLTVGEIGNLLIRLQALLRSLAELSRGGREQPRFIVKSIRGKNSTDLVIMLSILTVAASIPQHTALYRETAAKTFRKFKLSALAATETRGLKTTVTKGELDPALARQSLEELSPNQRKKLDNFLRALTKPAHGIVIGDEETEISLSRADLPKLL